jgi:hypothetical protein
MASIPDLTLDQVMPANIDAEKTILGAILLDNTAHSDAADTDKVCVLSGCKHDY